ncbi:histidinol-phosphatase HisJ [Bacillus horti]|uniref:Histidinol-phosphatase n=1 Tax=Caldalkalibacillus horti TaxID=77523 RepID=A0ABT9W0L2_9BACI|nr:histidinol-phosphatase HisJ [Bacillus horti]MDQ0166794.1 histidinol-phosphatase (PHP family) [Bacillus horti]
MKWDGHTHTPFCPHGSSYPLEDYVEQAIQLGFDIYSVTEHAPLPPSFADPVPDQDSAMAYNVLEQYLAEAERVKEKYKDKIEVRIGLEVDYIHGLEHETKAFLNKYGPRLQDSILSLHFLPIGTEWKILDFTADFFEQELIQHFSTVDLVYLHYYQILQQAVKADLGPHKPKRIGHFSLIEKFKRKFPSTQKEVWWEQALITLQDIKERGYSLDFNTAGYRKEDCLERYPSDQLLHYALSLRIPFVFGSDAHRPQEVGYRYTDFEEVCEKRK